MSPVTTARMRAVRQRDTKPELRLRSALFARGMRYRVNVHTLPGSPDLAFPRTRLAVFVHGCFWHGHRRCPRARLPKSNVEFWKQKLRQNRARDQKVRRRLISLHWHVIEVWECEILGDIDTAARKVVNAYTKRKRIHEG